VGLGLSKLMPKKGVNKKKKISLTYFKIPALGEPLRILLHLGGFDWSDEYPTDWAKQKPLTKWGQLPIMQIDGEEQMAQTKALFRFLAKQVVVEGATLYPEDPFAAFKVDEFIDAFEDVRTKIVPSFAIKDQAEKEAFRKALFEPGKGDCALILAKINAHAGTNGHIFGNDFSAADIWCFFFVNFFRCGFFDGLSGDVCDSYPNLMAVTTKVGNLPAIKAYYGAKKGEANYSVWAQ